MKIIRSLLDKQEQLFAKEQSWKSFTLSMKHSIPFYIPQEW